MEMLDIVDCSGRPTGQTAERGKVHREGIPHATSHVWLLRVKSARLQVLLQKRSDRKESFPGCYGASSAGHIPAGSSYAESAVRELEEELGIAASTEELVFCGDRTVVWDDCFFGVPFHDRQHSRIYYLLREQDEDSFRLQTEEVDSVCWADFEECLSAVRENRIRHCIHPEELEMVRAAFG